jgi:hypothetical protein
MGWPKVAFEATRTMMPFGFAGELVVPLLTPSPTAALRDRVVEALRSERARDMLVSERRIAFAGLTGTRTVRPLVNIEECEIRFEEDTESTRVGYVCLVERWNFFGVALISFGFVALAVSGSSAAPAAGVFALVVFVAVVGNSFVVRRRFRRWLTGVVGHDEDLGPGNRQGAHAL